MKHMDKPEELKGQWWTSDKATCSRKVILCVYTCIWELKTLYDNYKKITCSVMWILSVKN